jgi:integrase
MGVTLRKRKLPSGKTQLYLDVYRFGSRRFETLGLFLDGDRFNNRETLKMAEAIRARRELDLQAEIHGITGTHNRKSSFIKYLEGLKEARTSPNTQRSWKTAIGQLENFAGDSVTFGDLNKDFFERFKTYLLKRVSANSAKVYIVRLKTALHQAVKDNILAVSPARDVTIKKEDRLPSFLTLDEIRKLSSTPCANDQVKRAFLFSCFAGLRHSDVDALTWDKVKDGFLEFSQQKTGSRERLPLSIEAQRILEAQKSARPSPSLRRTFREGQVFFMPSHTVTNKALKLWAKKAKLGKPISFHQSRHSFATLSLTSGIDLYTVSKLLGHKNIQATQIYAKVIDEKKRQAVRMLPTLNGE